MACQKTLPPKIGNHSATISIREQGNDWRSAKAERRVGYDFNWNAPESLSLLDSLSDEKRDSVERVTDRIGGEAVPEDRSAVREGVRNAAERCFERKSVIPERTLLAEAHKWSVGTEAVQTVHQPYQQGSFITKEPVDPLSADHRWLEERRQKSMQQEGSMSRVNAFDRGTRSIEIEPEFQLILINPGEQRAKVIILVRQMLNLSPAEARRRIELGPLVIAEGLSHWQATRLKAELEALGAVVDVK